VLFVCLALCGSVLAEIDMADLSEESGAPDISGAHNLVVKRHFVAKGYDLGEAPVKPFKEAKDAPATAKPASKKAERVGDAPVPSGLPKGHHPHPHDLGEDDKELEEAMKYTKGMFDYADENKDGKLTVDEWVDKRFSGHKDYPLNEIKQGFFGLPWTVKGAEADHAKFMNKHPELATRLHKRMGQFAKQQVVQMNTIGKKFFKEMDLNVDGHVSLMEFQSENCGAVLGDETPEMIPGYDQLDKAPQLPDRATGRGDPRLRNKKKMHKAGR